MIKNISKKDDNYIQKIFKIIDNVTEFSYGIIIKKMYHKGYICVNKNNELSLIKKILLQTLSDNAK